MNAHPTTTRLFPRFALLAAALLAVSGCETVFGDTRPDSTPEEFVAAASALPAVEDVARTGGNSYSVELDTAADSDALRGTSEELSSLVNDYDYGDHTPTVVVTSGIFTGEVGIGVPNAGPGVPQPGPLQLEHLPYLHGLAGVYSGSVTEAGATVSIGASEDLADWVDGVVSDPHDVRLTVLRSPADPFADPDDDPSDEPSDGADDPDPDHNADDPGARITLDLGWAQIGEETRRLFDTIDATPGTLTEAGLDETTQDPDAAIVVPADDDVLEVEDAFAAEYGTDRLADVAVRSAEGLSVTLGSADLPAFFDAYEYFTDIGIAVESMDLERGALTLAVPDSWALGAMAEALAGSDTDLDADVRISVHNLDHPEHVPYFSASAWPGRVGLLGALWDDGFTAVKFSKESGRQDVSLRISPTPDQDLMSPGSRAALIRILRAEGWSGSARIMVGAGDTLSFVSTADGTAVDPYMARHDADSEPSGWAADFITEWDASAT